MKVVRNQKHKNNNKPDGCNTRRAVSTRSSRRERDSNRVALMRTAFSLSPVHPPPGRGAALYRATFTGPGNGHQMIFNESTHVRTACDGAGSVGACVRPHRRSLGRVSVERVVAGENHRNVSSAGQPAVLRSCSSEYSVHRTCWGNF